MKQFTLTMKAVRISEALEYLTVMPRRNPKEDHNFSTTAVTT
jgi:hypothetical protein